MENGTTTVLNGAAKAPKQAKRMLWTHPDPDSTRMAEFMRSINHKYGLNLKSYDDLYRWSIDEIASFWAEVWNFTGITAEKGFDEVRQIFLSRDRYSPFATSC
jgi:acetoacetyl-CoA synthetase